MAKHRQTGDGYLTAFSINRHAKITDQIFSEIMLIKACAFSHLSLIIFLVVTGQVTLQAEEHAPAGSTAIRNESESGSGPLVPAGRSRYWQRISAYEPSYFLIEPVPPRSRAVNAKIQVSFAFQLVGDPQFTIVKGDERANGLYGAFSQTSYWNLGAESKPFLDTSYRPELFWHQGFNPGLVASDGLAVDSGFGHESNGRAGEDTRSYNVIYVRPQIRWDMVDGWWFRVAPKIQTYVGSLEENPEIKRYRGYGDLDLTFGIRDGALLTMRGRLGERTDRGSIQADLSYPSDRITGGWTHGYVYLQSFWGWSETLVAYDQRVEQPRVLIGFAITR